MDSVKYSLGTYVIENYIFLSQNDPPRRIYTLEVICLWRIYFSLPAFPGEKF